MQTKMLCGVGLIGVVAIIASAVPVVAHHAFGAMIVVDGYQSKDRTARANGRDVTFEDGSKFFMGSSGTGAPRDGRDSTEPE